MSENIEEKEHTPFLLGIVLFAVLCLLFVFTLVILFPHFAWWIDTMFN